jgi:hypothetical protein
MMTPVEVDGAPAREAHQVLFRVVDTAYFRTTGIPVLRGRDFTADEVRHRGDAIVVNQAFATRYLPGGDPISKRITVRKSAQGRPEFGEPVRATIIGVVGDVRHFSLDIPFTPEVYLPYTLTVWGWMSVVVRAAGDPAALVPAVARAARSVQPDLPITGASITNRVYDLPEMLRQSLAIAGSLPGCSARSRCLRCCSPRLASAASSPISWRNGIGRSGSAWRSARSAGTC